MSEDQALIQQCRSSIAKGSKTFTFASRFFARDKMDHAALLYTWCRHCDDAIDACPPEKLDAELFRLKEETSRALSGARTDLSVPFAALRYVVTKNNIPAEYPLELLEGMAMDAKFRIPMNFRDLDLYCYRVAGVVGLMMAHIMGVSDERALRHACDLGCAMQLTNIARDVLADHALGRCYLPADLLDQHRLTPSNYALASNRRQLAHAVAELLDRAHAGYLSGEQGTKYLDRSSALVILIARFAYAEIGHHVLAAGPRAWDTRQYTTPLVKIKCLGRAMVTWFKQLFNRPAWQPAAIQQIWRPQ